MKSTIGSYFLRLMCLLVIGSLLALIGCNRDPEEPVTPDPVLNPSSKYQICNNIVTDCRESSGSYCLNGFTWGETNPLPFAGQVTGPMEPGGNITYSFQEENRLVNTHAQIDLPSQSFDELAACAKTEIRKAMSDWESYANISLTEVDQNSDSDIKIFVADIRQSGVGFPNFPSAECNVLGGTLVIQADLWTDDCTTMYKFFLHEIGHVLGLGHVGSRNIMNADFEVINELEGLQIGDIEGVLQLYGPK